MIGNGQPKGGSVSLTIDPAAQDAAYDGLRALGPGRRGRGRGARAVHRQDPGDGVEPDLRPQQAGLPRLRRGRRRPTTGSIEAEDEPLLNRAIQAIYPPGSTFKLVTAAAAIESGQLRRRTRWSRAAVDLDLPQTDRGYAQRGGGDCGGDQIP